MSLHNDLIKADHGTDAISIRLVNAQSLATLKQSLNPGQRALLDAQRFTGTAGQVAVVPAAVHEAGAWFAIGGVADPTSLSSWCLARLAETLPAGTYRLAEGVPGKALLGWQSAQYRFVRYREDPDSTGARVLLTHDVTRAADCIAQARAAAKVADLVNTPAEDMGPAALEAEAEALTKAHGAMLTVTRGEALEREFPLVHAVGRAATRHHAPRMIELTWGREDAPRLALVGKGVTFDTGGLDIKGASGMLLMKKDMGGAAHVLALAGLVMGGFGLGKALDVRLHMVVPAVENAIAGNAFRPGDVLASRKGLTVEIGNTDAEGRLILADALTLASEQAPDLILDFATLTGAARVALGPDLPALMARRDATAEALIAAGCAHDDDVWRLPLPAAYAEYLKSDIADTGNAPANGYAGASVAGLFLDKFVGEGPDGTPIDWAHFDTFAWRPAAKPGRPKGGAALGLRAAFYMLEQRYG